MGDLKSGIEHLKQAKAHMSKANGIMSDCISKFKALEEENAELRDELAALVDGQDTYKHQVLMMLAVLLCYACDIKERLE